MRLTQHFTLEELTASQVAARNGLENEPDEETLWRLRRLAAYLERVREALHSHPIIVTSGYRSPEVNRLVGGSPRSAHMRGLAADIIAPTFGTPLQVAERIVEELLPFDQLIHEYGGWVHFAIGGGSEDTWRREMLTKCRGKPYQRGLHPCSS